MFASCASSGIEHFLKSLGCEEKRGFPSEAFQYLEYFTGNPSAKKRNKYNNIMRLDLTRRLFLDCLTSGRALFFYYYLIIMLLPTETLNKSKNLTQNSVWRWNVFDFNSGGHKDHSSTCVFWMRPTHANSFPSLNRAENKERSSTSAAARADTKTYVLFRSRAVKGAFHEGTKRWGGGRSARHYHFPPALRVPFKRWVMSLAAILRPPLTPSAFQMYFQPSWKK